MTDDEIPPYALRPATPDDFEFVWDLRKVSMQEHVAATYGEWDDAWQMDRFRSKFDPAGIQIIMVEGRAVGELTVQWDEDPVFLALILLAPDVQRRGIGTAVIRDVSSKARRLGRAVSLQVFRVNDEARRLYERLGFEVVGQTQTHTQMRWVRPGDDDDGADHDDDALQR